MSITTTIEARIKEIDSELQYFHAESAKLGRLTLEDQECWSDRAQMKLEISYEIDGLQDERAQLVKQLQWSAPQTTVHKRADVPAGFYAGCNRDGEEGLFEDYEESIGEA